MKIKWRYFKKMFKKNPLRNPINEECCIVVGHDINNGSLRKNNEYIILQMIMQCKRSYVMNFKRKF